MRSLLSTVFILVAMLVGDALWLGTMMSRLYLPQMPTLIAAQTNLAAAAGFYLLYASALSYLVVLPLAPSTAPVAWRELLLRAAVFGLAAYGTYDLTGLAVIRDWPVGLSFIDMAWGACLTAIAAVSGAMGTRLIKRR